MRGLGLPGGQVRVRTGCLRARSHLHRTDDQRLVVAPSALTLRGAAYPRLVHLDVPFPADAIALWTNHRGSQLVQHLECRLVPSQAQELLELQGRHSGGMARDEPCPPEPGGDGHLRFLHDRPGGQPGVALAQPTPEHVRLVLEAVGLAPGLAVRADEASREACDVEVCHAGALVREDPLEVRQRPRGREVRSGSTLAARAAGVHGAASTSRDVPDTCTPPTISQQVASRDAGQSGHKTTWDRHYVQQPDRHGTEQQRLLNDAPIRRALHTK